jgi:hypothetical protein
MSLGGIEVLGVRYGGDLDCMGMCGWVQKVQR